MEFYVIPVSSGSDKYILYRPLAGLAFIGNRAMANLTQALLNNELDASAQVPENMLAFLRSSGYLEPDPPAPGSPLTAFAPTMAVLLLSNQCQLRCIYCYAAAGEANRNELSLDLGCVAIRAVYENARRSGAPCFEVSFHGGGEPVLAWNVLQASTAFAKSLPYKSQITLTTNGIWSQKQCDWIIENLDGLTLSMDGCPETQNHQRPFTSGRGSYSQVIRTVNELDRHAFQYSIRLTATAPWNHLPEEIHFLCNQTGCQTFQVEPAFNAGRGGHGQPAVEQGRAFVHAFLEAIDIAAKAGRHLFFSGARLGTITSAFCTAPYQALIVNANGDLVTCYEIASDDHRLAEISIIGKIVAGQVSIDQDRRLRLLNQLSERRKGCKECFCYWSCAGNCYSRAFGTGEDGYLKRDVRCEINRVITEGLLLQGIEEAEKQLLGDGVWRSPYQAYSNPIVGF